MFHGVQSARPSTPGEIQVTDQHVEPIGTGGDVSTPILDHDLGTIAGRDSLVVLTEEAVGGVDHLPRDLRHGHSFDRFVLQGGSWCDPCCQPDECGMPGIGMQYQWEVRLPLLVVLHTDAAQHVLVRYQDASPKPFALDDRHQTVGGNLFGEHLESQVRIDLRQLRQIAAHACQGDQGHSAERHRAG